MKRAALLALSSLAIPAVALALQANVSLAINSISPSTLTINPGDTVVWTNESGLTQSVTSDNGAFQSGAINGGGQFAATFNTPGTYQYYDNASGVAVQGQVVVGNGYTPTTNAVIPTGSSVSNPGDANSLTNEVQSLISEINAIEGGSTAATSAGAVAGVPSYGGGVCPQFTRPLSLGSSGSDVTQLQEFLALNRSIYPEGFVTGYFGSLTQTAVQRWQSANGVVSSGSPSTTGYGVVGPHTSAAMRAACTSGAGASSNSNTAAAGVTGTVGAFLQVTPISGSSPLPVSAVATVNTAGSCSGASYTLDFGDGSAPTFIPVAAGNCSPAEQTVQHSYHYGGVYTITLSSGTHYSTATVTVASNPPPGSSSGTSGSTSNPSQAVGSLSAVVTSGPAPFNATFYVSCASGLAFDVVFGDGTDLGGNNVSQTSCNGGLQAVTHTYQSGGNFTAKLVIFIQNSNGTVSPTTVATQQMAVGNAQASVAPSFSASPASGASPLAVTFSGVVPGNFGYSINFGDNSTPATVSPQGLTCPVSGACTGPASANVNQSHTYQTAGSYTATLSSNGSNLANATVTVSAPATNGSGNSPNSGNTNTNSRTYPPPSLTPDNGGNPFAVLVQFTYDSGGCPSVDWGDGSTWSPSGCSGNLTGNSQTFSQTHTYSHPGSFTITVARGSQSDTLGVAVSG